MTLIHLFNVYSDLHFHFHMRSGVGNFLAEKHWDVYEYKPSNSLQDASGSSLAGSTNYLNYGAARCSSAAQFFIADNVFARRDLQYSPLLANMLTSLFILRTWKHTRTAAVPILLPNISCDRRCPRHFGQVLPRNMLASRAGQRSLLDELTPCHVRTDARHGFNGPSWGLRLFKRQADQLPAMMVQDVQLLAIEPGLWV